MNMNRTCRSLSTFLAVGLFAFAPSCSGGSDHPTAETTGDQDPASGGNASGGAGEDTSAAGGNPSAGSGGSSEETSGGGSPGASGGVAGSGGAAASGGTSASGGETGGSGGSGHEPVLLPQEGNPVLSWFKGARTKWSASLANVILSYQQSHGGWPKNIDYAAAGMGNGGSDLGTIDNGATVTEIVYLAELYKQSGNASYGEAARRDRTSVV